MTGSMFTQQVTDHVMQYKENYYRLAFSYVRNSQDALDIVQEAVYKAITSKTGLKSPEYIRTWFYRIVVNTALDFLRKHKRVIAVDDAKLSEFEGGNADKYSDIDLQQALENLPDQYRTIIILRYFEDLKLQEIAEVLDENVNTVKTHLYKALKLLRIRMDD